MAMLNVYYLQHIYIVSQRVLLLCAFYWLIFGMEINFNGKTALVTGAGDGIGRAIAKRLIQYGATVYALSRTAAHLESLKQEVPKINILQVDLQDWEKTAEAVKSIGQVDLLVNNAAVAHLESFLDVTPEIFDRCFNVNLKAIINVSQVVAKSLIKSNAPGSIVNISSQASQVALKDHTVYCATKGALDIMSKVMALELGPHKIRVNCVNPTVVMTAMGKIAWSDPEKANPILSRIPLGRFSEIDEVVDAVVFLLSDRASMINAATLPVDGGFLAC